MRAFVRAAPVVALLVVVTATGCDGTPSPAMGEYVDVKGTVTLADGRPVKAATIYFQPEVPGQGRDQFVDVKDGVFELKLFAANYKVAFDVEGGRGGVPGKYTRFDSAALKAEVKSGMQPLSYTLK